MTTRSTAWRLCLVSLVAILILAGCRRPDDSPPVTPSVTPLPAQVTSPSSPVASIALTPPPTHSPALLFRTRDEETIVAAWPAGQVAQFVAPGSALDGQPLSPDGRQMVIDVETNDKEPYPELALLNLSDGYIEPLRLLSKPYRVHWSPDGRYLLYVYQQESGDQLVLYDFAGGDNVAITTMPSISFAAGWSADGRQIAFMAQADGQYDLYLLDVASRAVRRLTNNLAVETAAVWSPVDHTLLVGTTRYDERVLWEGSPYGITTLYLISSDGQSQTLGYYDLITSPSLAWSPDGHQIAFSEKGALCILDLATRQTTCPLAETTPFGDYFAAFGEPPVWSPDSRWLAFRAAGHDDGSNCGGVYALALATGAVSIVEEGSCQTGPLFWVGDWPALPPQASVAAQSPAPHPLPSPEPSATPTLIATRTMDEREALLAQLMAQPAACPLPCWWGFEMPISLASVDSRLAELGLPGLMMTMPAHDDPGKMGSIDLGYHDPAATTNYHMVDVWTQFHAIDDEVVYIAVTASRPLVGAGWVEFQRDWEPYYFDAIIEMLCLPPYASLAPLSWAESTPGKIMVLFYPERGINVTYTFRDSAATQTPGEFCFDLSLVQELRLSLYTPYTPAQVEGWASYLLPPELNSNADPLDASFTWQAQTGQDFVSFYKDYQASGRPCIELEHSLSSR